MIELHDVERRFGHRVVLHGVTLRLEPPGIVGLIGDNGAGKTTLMRLVAGILRPNSGTVRVFGRNPYVERAAVLRRVGALIESPGHYDELSVRDNLTYFFGFYANGDRTAVARHVDANIERFGLAAVTDTRAGELSSGYRQRLAIARAVHPWAELMLLDEPFNTLDPRSRNEIKVELRRLREDGKLILLSSHQLADVQQLCDTILVIAGQRVHQFQSFEQIRELLDSDPGEDLDAVYALLADRLVAKGGVS